MLGQVILDLVSTGADFVPVVGDAKGAVEFAQNPTLLGGAALAIGVVPVVGDGVAARIKVANKVPDTLARVIPGNVNVSTLGRAKDGDVFVTAADDIAGLDAAGIEDRPTIAPSHTFTVIEFPSNAIDGIATPVNRSNPVCGWWTNC